MDLFVVTAFLIFTSAMLVAGYYAFSVPRQKEANHLTARLRELRTRTGTRSRGPTDLVRREQHGTFSFLIDFVSWLGVLRRIQELIDQADKKYRAVDVIAISLIAAVGAWFVFGVFGLSLLLLRLLFAVVVGCLPLTWILQVRRRRLTKFGENLPDSIDLFNRSMKAGHTIHSGLETIGTESLEPVRMEFKKVVEELALGSTLEDALHGLGRRVPLIDLKFFITGLILQRQTGANMVEVLDNLALLVRERLNMVAKMKAHTAQQRLSAGLLCIMPVVVGFGFWIVKPEYIEMLFTDETGSLFLTVAVVLEIVGILIIRKIASPRF